MPNTSSMLRALVVGAAFSVTMARTKDAAVDRRHGVARIGDGKHHVQDGSAPHQPKAHKESRKKSHKKSRKKDQRKAGGKASRKSRHAAGKEANRGRVHDQAGHKASDRARHHKRRPSHQNTASRPGKKAGSGKGSGHGSQRWWGDHFDGSSDWDMGIYGYDGWNMGSHDWGDSEDWDWGNSEDWNMGSDDWDWGNHDWGNSEDWNIGSDDWDWGSEDWGNSEDWDMGSHDWGNSEDWNMGSEDWNVGSQDWGNSGDTVEPTPGPEPDPATPLPNDCATRVTRDRSLKRLFEATRIVGGAPVSPRQYPFQVSLQDGNFHFCGGSLIAPGWVLTAAHCGQVQVVEIGAHDLEADDTCVERIRVTQTLTHPQYNENTLENDIALLKLERESAYAPIGISAGGAVEAAGILSTVSGWGTLSEGGSAPDVLHAVNVPIVTNRECNNAYNGDIVNSMICAGLAEGGKDSCQGDSGGPLFVPSVGGYTQIGVVSWGEGCAQANKYGVYTRLSSFRSWICSSTGVACN